MRDLTTLDGLLAEHAERAALLDAAIDVTDSLTGQKEAQNIAYRDQFAISDLVDATVLEICIYRPRTVAEQTAKAKFLLRWIGGVDSLSGDEARALLNSMIEGGANV